MKFRDRNRYTYLVLKEAAPMEGAKTLPAHCRAGSQINEICKSRLQAQSHRAVLQCNVEGQAPVMVAREAKMQCATIEGHLHE